MQRKAVDSSNLFPPPVLSDISPPKLKNGFIAPQPTLSSISHVPCGIWDQPSSHLSLLDDKQVTSVAPEQKTSSLKKFHEHLRQRFNKLGKGSRSKGTPIPSQPILPPIPHAASRLADGEPHASLPFDEDWIIIATPEQETLHTLKTLHKNLRQQLHKITGTDNFFPPMWTDNPNIHIAIQDIQRENTALQTLLTKMTTLQAVTTTRDSLIQQLKATPTYTPHFDYFLTTWTRFSDPEVEVDRALYYTEKVNNLLRLSLQNTVVHTLFMTLALERKKQVSINDELFIHSQAIHYLLSLKLISSLCLNHPSLSSPLSQPQACYKMLISFGQQLATTISLMTFIGLDHNVITLKDQQLWGAHSQLIVSILYQAQEQADFHFPFEILPLDTVHEVPETLLEQVVAKAKVSNPLELGAKLYDMVFWQYYLVTGYKNDPTINNTPLELVCKHIKAARQIHPADGEWCKHYPNEIPTVAREKALCSLFAQALQEMLKKL